MPHINNTDTIQSGAQMDSPANTPYRRTNSNTAAASMAFMLRTAMFLFDGYKCGRGYLKIRNFSKVKT